MATTLPARITASSLATAVDDVEAMRCADLVTLNRYVTGGIQAIEMVERAYVALAIVHGGKIYKETHHSFEAYMDEMYGRSVRSGYRWVRLGKAILDAETAEDAMSDDLSPIPEKGHFVYRLWDDDDLLYVGVSSRLRTRLMVHRGRWPLAEATWEEYPTRKEAEDAETLAIGNDCPAFNLAGR